MARDGKPLGAGTDRARGRRDGTGYDTGRDSGCARPEFGPCRRPRGSAGLSAPAVVECRNCTPVIGGHVKPSPADDRFSALSDLPCPLWRMPDGPARYASLPVGAVPMARCTSGTHPPPVAGFDRSPVKWSSSAGSCLLSADTDGCLTGPGRPARCSGPGPLRPPPGRTARHTRAARRHGQGC
uniref:Putative hygromycin B biosynthetic protein n=1 Tax=Streptomyces hygroscopicus subsp. hygroscopicus TaxID=68042 RepID=Q2MFR2_STRHY|nr:putative hygromycin B biosynthetic protein [Streptomyces hygroscopicus subsp. hygroscopicus]